MVSFKNAVKERTLQREKMPIWLKLHGKMVFFGIMFIMGVLIGAFVSVWVRIGDLGGVSLAVEKFVEGRQLQTITKTFFSALTPNMVSWAVLFICGFCAVSAPIISFVPCLRGMGYGVLACALLLRYPDSGLQYILVFMLPNLVISIITLLFCCCDSLTMSRYFWQSMSARPRLDSTFVSTFCGKMLLYSLFIIAGAAIEAYTYSLFC